MVAMFVCFCDLKGRVGLPIQANASDRINHRCLEIVSVQMECVGV